MNYANKRSRGPTALGALCGVATTLGIAGPAVAGPVTLLTYIPVPADAANTQPGGAFTSFDISFANSVTGNIFIADRSNAAVDIFSGSSLTFLGRASGFTGQQATTSVSGPDGVLTVTSGGVTTLYAGDGDSTLKVFNATNPAAPVLQQSIFTGGTTRVDEMTYSPSTHQVLAANNAETPAYGNLFSTNNGHPPVALTTTPIAVPAALGGIPLGGMEQPGWNQNSGTFFVSIPQLFGGNDPGGVAEISTAGQVLQTIDFTSFGIASCSPTGLAVSTSGNMLVGCGNAGTQAVLLDKNGQIVTMVAGLGGTDEIWYDPITDEFYVTGNNGSSTTRFFDVLAANGIFLQTVDLPTTPSAHSITVDPFNGDIFVPLAGTTAAATNSVCPLGCVAVYASVVPEPSSLLLALTALLGLAGFGWLRRAAAY